MNELEAQYIAIRERDRVAKLEGKPTSALELQLADIHNQMMDHQDNHPGCTSL